MPKTTISIDNRALAPWCEVADVLGLSLPQFLEWLIGYIGSYRNERAMVLDETATQNVYPTQEQAAAVAERLEAWGAGECLAGRGNVMVADVVPQGEAWKIETDLSCASAICRRPGQ